MIIRLSSLGDTILASSVIQPLWQAGFIIDFLTFKPFGQIFEKDYRLNRVISVERYQLKSLTSIIRFARSLGEYEYILDLHKNLRTFLISMFVPGRSIRYNKKSISRRLSKLSPNFNVVYAYLDLLEKLGIQNPRQYRPKIILSEDEIKKASEIISGKFIAVGTGARYKNKVYPHYNKVIDILLNRGYSVVLVGSKEDKELDLNTYDDRVVDLRGRISLRETMAVISKADLTISNDSAVAHMSRAVSTPVLMVYGATHPYLGFAPLEDEGNFIFKNLSCQPCDIHGKGECRRKDLACLNLITPEEIAKKALEMVG